jgi:hypothetical protein
MGVCPFCMSNRFAARFERYFAVLWRLTYCHEVKYAIPWLKDRIVAKSAPSQDGKK